MTNRSDAQPDVVGLYEKAAAGTRAYLASVRVDQWENATPCDEWNVRQLVNHIVGGVRNTKVLLEGGESQSSVGVDLLGDNPLGAFDDALDGALAAIRADGALKQTVHARYGEIPGAV